jgi:hypothetical protein
VIRSGRRGSWLLLVAVVAVGCATGVPPDTYSGVGDDGVGTVDAAGDQSEAASEGSAVGPVSDATARDTGVEAAPWQPDAVAGEDAHASADTGQDTSSQEASADVIEADSNDDDAEADGASAHEGGAGSDSGGVCNKHTCSGCCDTSRVCHTQPSPDACPTSFQAGGPCEDCTAEGEAYCVFDLILYVCSSTP